ncbi:unnamed protein product, partial [marine sediment metagenome]
IKMVNDYTSAAHEVARYVARPSAISKLALEQRIELFTAMHGRRLCGKWGEANVLSLSKPKSTEPGDWERLARWDTIRDRLGFDLDAQDIYHAWRNQTFLSIDVSYMEIEDFLDDVPGEIEPEPPPPLLWGDPV